MMQALEGTEVTTRMTPCGGPLGHLEIPMITTMVRCVSSEHRRINDLTMELAYAATRLANEPDSATARQHALEIWSEIRGTLWSHLQVEDELVLTWGEAHHAIADTLLDTLKIERQEMSKLVGVLPSSAGADGDPQAIAAKPDVFAHTLIAFAQMLDSHVERYDGEVLPSILRALFRK